MSKQTVVVIGASGVIGGGHVRRLAGRDNVDVIALSRRPLGVDAANLLTLPVDLADPVADLAPLGPVTHAVYCAYAAADGEEAQRAANAALCESALALLERACPRLQHVTLLQGMKAYGSHLGPFRTPAKESDPRHQGPNFYFDQEDALAARAARHGWRWAVLRPHVVVGPAWRSPMNLAAVLTAYGLDRRARGLPFSFPGPEAAFDIVYQATDADLLSRAIEWAGTLEVSGEAFNITNGDFFRWRNAWPRLAAVFDLDPAGPEPRRLTEEMAGAPTPDGLEVSWAFADYVFHTTWDVMADTLKCRRHGFLEFLDSEAMLVDRCAEMRRLIGQT